MKKSAIIRIVIWSFVALLLMSMLIGFLFIDKLKLPKNWDIGSLGTTYQYADRYTVGGGSISENIEEIEINWVSGSVNMQAYNGNTIELSETDIDDEDYRMRYLVENGKLTVQFYKSGLFFGIHKSFSKNLTVKIPEPMLENMKKITVDNVSSEVSVKDIKAIDSIDIETVSGDVQLENASAKSFGFDTVSGELKAKNVDFYEVDTDSVSGNISMEGKVVKLSSDSTSGKVEVKTSVSLEKAECSAVSGDVCLTIPEENGFTAEFDSVSGDFNTDLSIMLKSGKKIFGDGTASFEFDSTSGDVTIRKN